MGKGKIRVEFLRDLLVDAELVKVKFFLEEDLLKSYDATYFITVKQDGKLDQHEIPWGPEIEEFFLFERPTKMIDRNSEVARFANILINNFKNADITWGKDYVRSVITEYLREHDEYGLHSILDKISVPRPYNGNPSQSYQDCSNFIQHAIQGLQNTAVLTLGYPDDNTTVDMIGEAIATVLDFKFHISLREKLFPKWR